jgi:hypothetical protein
MTTGKFTLFAFLLLLLAGMIISCNNESKPQIDLWYGPEQYFGYPGNTQKFINILGNMGSEVPLVKQYYSLNGAEAINFNLGTDLHRLAMPGDFNIEFPRELLNVGENQLFITAIDSLGRKAENQVTIHYQEGHTWPLPYTIQWDTVTNLQHVVQVLDGKWELTPDGARVVESYYDRTLAFGDASWVDYEITAEVLFHDYTPPYDGAPNYNVTHAAIALRWPGFDTDEHSPYRKWFPLGATCEIRLTHDLDSCSFRILAGGRKRNLVADRYHTLKLNEWYIMKARVVSLTDTSSVYNAKIWPKAKPEPEGWDIEYVKEQEEVFSGCGLVLAHHSVVTFGRISAVPVLSEKSVVGNQ